MISGHQLSRVCREPGYQAPSGSEEPPAFMVAPTTIARSAVRQLHTSGAETARSYLQGSKVGEWTGHTNKSMASGANAVVDGFDWYISHDESDGRRMAALDESAVVELPAGAVRVRLDVVLEDEDDLAGRVVLWDGLQIDAASAPVIACVFAHALETLYPRRSFTTIGVWQARRQQLIEVSHADALAQTAAASARLAGM
ncbi:MAG: hypothetical protein JW940_21650 [Polyangiaceae bacterium]|nr:hypothetical protein [Polyangiaceae bacterium]